MLALSELEPLDLELQKELLRLLLRGGHYSEAERRLVVIRRRFRRTLGEVPDVDLAALRAESTRSRGDPRGARGRSGSGAPSWRVGRPKLGKQGISARLGRSRAFTGR